METALKIFAIVFLFGLLITMGIINAETERVLESKYVYKIEYEPGKHGFCSTALTNTYVIKNGCVTTQNKTVICGSFKITKINHP